MCRGLSTKHPKSPGSLAPGLRRWQRTRKGVTFPGPHRRRQSSGTRASALEPTVAFGSAKQASSSSQFNPNSLITSFKFNACTVHVISKRQIDALSQTVVSTKFIIFVRMITN